MKKASCLVTFPCEIQRAEEISLEALDYGAGQTLAKLEIKPVDSSFEQYEKQVNTLVAAMSRKEIKKAVLSRTVTLNRSVVSDGQLFFDWLQNTIRLLFRGSMCPV